MTLCNTFKRLAFDTWDEIHKSRQVNFQLKEETFIDKNMLELKLKHTSQVRTKVFTKHEEGKNGADWEWWFKGNTNNWVGFRVQAKIINILSNEFEHIHYKTPSTGVYQCDKLIKTALTGPNPRIPLYCLFLQTNDKRYLNTWNCRTVPHIKDLYGCSLTSAFLIRNFRASKKKHLSDLENYMRPWHCLVCCKDHGNRDFIRNIESYAKTVFKLDPEIAKDLDINIPNSFISQNPPFYVTSILENENNDIIDSPDENLRGVVVITEGE